MSQNYKDFSFVLSEIRKFSSDENRADCSLSEMLALLPHPSGVGQMRCGEKAFRKLYEIAQRALLKSEYRDRLDVETVFQELNKAFVRQCFVKRRILSVSEADKIISMSLRLASKSCVTIEHFIPCDLFVPKDVNDLSIGPVKFYFINDNISLFKDIILMNQEKHVSFDGVENIDKAIDYFSSYNSLAQVTIEGCEASVSRQRSGFIVQRAIDFLHVLLLVEYAEEMRMGGPLMKSDIRARVERVLGEEYCVGIELNFKLLKSDIDWVEKVLEPYCRDLLSVISTILCRFLAGSSENAACQRALDAIGWFGEADRDRFNASKVVKYITAMERILITSESKVSSKFRKRGAALLYGLDGRSQVELDDSLSKAYDLRSRLVHGSYSISNDVPRWQAAKIKILSSNVILRYMRFIKIEYFERQSMSDRELDNIYEQLTAWASTRS